MESTGEKIEKIVRGIYSSETTPLHVPHFFGNEKKYLNECIDSTFVSSVGKFVDKVEEDFASYVDAPKAVAVVNGTAGLHTALILGGVKAKDEVLSQALTFVATGNAIHYAGASPVFIDVDYDTMGLSPTALHTFLENNAEKRNGETFNKKTNNRIKACVVMHTFGFAARIEEIQQICKEWNIFLIEDAAEAVGSKLAGKHLGTFGDIGVFSFNGNKIITSGGGGLLVSNNKELMHQAKHLTTTAKVPHAYEYAHDQVGFNYRMPNINAALLCAQLENLDTFIASKRKIAQQYQDAFAAQKVLFRTEMANSRANYWLMCVELKNRKEREEVLQYTNKQGIMTRPIWKLLYKLPMFQDAQRDNQTNAELLEDRIVNIPSSAIL